MVLPPELLAPNEIIVPARLGTTALTPLLAETGKKFTPLLNVLPPPLVRVVIEPNKLLMVTTTLAPLPYSVVVLLELPVAAVPEPQRFPLKRLPQPPMVARMASLANPLPLAPTCLYRFPPVVLVSRIDIVHRAAYRELFVLKNVELVVPASPIPRVALMSLL